MLNKRQIRMGIGVFLLGVCMTSWSVASAGRGWWSSTPADTAEKSFESCEYLSKAQRQTLIAQYHSIDNDDEKNQLKHRIEWFCRLSEQEQQHLRFAWQSMSSKQRQALKQLLKSTHDPEQREKIRQDILQKYPLPQSYLSD